MGSFWLVAGEFLVEHYDVIEAVEQAIEGGATKAEVLKAIRSTVVAASDAVVEAELGPRPKP